MLGFSFGILLIMRNNKRIFGGELNPAYRWSSYGDLMVLKFIGFFILFLVLPLIFWVMWGEAKRVNDFPKVSCGVENCRFDFENGTSKVLPRNEVPFDENGVVIKDQVIFSN